MFCLFSNADRGFQIQGGNVACRDGSIGCIHPCALLIQAINPKWPTPLTYLNTLDAYGWLDCVGRPDVARAEREIARVEKLKEN